MTLLSAWALAGLVLLAPLVVLHLQRSRLPRREVASLLVWQALPGEPSRQRRRRLPPLPLLLLLQALALIVLVLALARPGTSAHPGRPVHVYVLDDSVWMQAGDGGTTRLATAMAQLRQRLAALSSSAPVRVVVAGATPDLLFSGDAGKAAPALARVAPADGGGELAPALRLAAGLRRRPSDPVVLLHAPENTPPHVTAATGAFTAATVGGTLDDRALTGVTARCGLPGSVCEALARVTNSGPQAVQQRVDVLNGDAAASSSTVSVPAHGSAPVAFHVPAGARIELRLSGGDDLAADDDAWVVVPAAASPVRATLVGDPSAALALASAVAAVPGAQVQLRTGATYRAADARNSDLVVLDGALPGGTLPASAGVLLVAPPRLPGGAVRGAMTDARVSDEAGASPLLAGVDLTSLAVDPSVVNRLVLPHWMTAVLSAPSGPLLAAGTVGGRRVVVLAFDPGSSSLPQLSTFPVLVANLLAWTQEWVPSSAVAGQPVAVDLPPGSGATRVSSNGQLVRTLPKGRGTVPLTLTRPGLYEVAQTRTAGTSTTELAVNASPPPAAGATPLDLSHVAAEPAGGSLRSSWAPWLLGFAMLVLIVEALLAARVRRPVRTVA